jgi:hypothetical protein
LPCSGISEIALNAVLAVIEAAAPKDEIEGSARGPDGLHAHSAMAVLARLGGGAGSEQRVAALGSAPAARLGELILLISLSPRAAARGVATAQQRCQPIYEQLQLEFAKFSHDRIDPLMHLGRSARLLVHVSTKRKARPVNHTAHQRRQTRDANKPYSVRVGGKSSFVKVIDTAWLCTGKNVVVSN